MPMLMEELIAAWRALERHCDSLTEDDPDREPCLALIAEMGAAYGRLANVWPRTKEDDEAVLLQIAAARGFIGRHVVEA